MLADNWLYFSTLLKFSHYNSDPLYTKMYFSKIWSNYLTWMVENNWEFLFSITRAFEESKIEQEVSKVIQSFSAGTNPMHTNCTTSWFRIRMSLITLSSSARLSHLLHINTSMKYFTFSDKWNVINTVWIEICSVV